MKPKSEIKAAAKGAVSEDRALPNKTVTYFSWSMKLAEISRHFSDFGLPNALLAANLSGNPANLWVNGAFLGDNRPYDGIGIV